MGVWINRGTLALDVLGDTLSIGCRAKVTMGVSGRGEGEGASSQSLPASYQVCPQKGKDGPERIALG